MPVRSRRDGAVLAACLDLRRVGREWSGPCPRCGGRDRFHVRADGLFGCRGCGEDSRGLYRAVLEAAGEWRARPETRTRRRPPCERKTKPALGRRRLARAAWTAARPALDTPAEAYLRRRGGWRETLPPSVRWLRLADVPEAMMPRGLTEPTAIAGLVLFAYTRGPAVHSVKCEALADNGERLQDDAGPYKRNYGARDGALFVALDAPGGDWHLTEGEADALAVAADLSERGEPGRVVCASGTSGWTAATCADVGDHAIVLHPDRDGPGLNATSRLLSELTRAGKSAAVRPCYQADDPAGEMEAPREQAGSAAARSPDKERNV